MNATQTDDTNNASQGTQTDQYDHILRAMENGLLISINNDAKGSTPTGELKVVYSKDDKTHVQLKNGDEHYQIHRNVFGDLVYSELTED
jgi:hypothetical protein